MKTAGWRVERSVPVHLAGKALGGMSQLQGPGGSGREQTTRGCAKRSQERPGRALRPALRHRSRQDGIWHSEAGQHHLGRDRMEKSALKPEALCLPKCMDCRRNQLEPTEEPTSITGEEGDKRREWSERQRKPCAQRGRRWSAPSRLLLQSHLGPQAQGEVHLLCPLSSGQGSGHSLSQIRSLWGGIFHMWSFGGHDSVHSRHTAWGNYVIKKLLKSSKWQQNIILNVRNTFFKPMIHIWTCNLFLFLI